MVYWLLDFVKSDINKIVVFNQALIHYHNINDYILNVKKTNTKHIIIICVKLLRNVLIFDSTYSTWRFVSYV